METQDAHPLEPRFPTVDDLLFLCARLNETGANYLVIGGWAVIQHGFERTTSDIDLMVEATPENFQKIKSAMLKLPDGAIREVAPDDLDQFIVVRVGDEFVVDLMKRSCGIEYAQASRQIEWVTIKGVKIPFASPELLWRTKQTHRDKDALDRAFLTELLKNRGTK